MISMYFTVVSSRARVSVGPSRPWVERRTGRIDIVREELERPVERRRRVDGRAAGAPDRRSDRAGRQLGGDRVVLALEVDAERDGAAEALELVAAGVGGAVKVERDASAVVRRERVQRLIDVANLVACGALPVDQRASGRFAAGRVSSCEFPDTCTTAVALATLACSRRRSGRSTRRHQAPLDQAHREAATKAA
jgi:hypothetical protein